ncbi:MAG: ABC transporter permease subunit [Actinomycetota bacterium]|nr:ABC transporter permease subunit [Actinomycetota bacterium]
MSTATATPPPTKEQQPAPPPDKQSHKALFIAGVVAVFVIASFPFKGVATLPLARSDLTDFQSWLGKLSDKLQAAQDSSTILQGLDKISNAIEKAAVFLQELLSQPSFPRPVPEIGWLGVIAIAILVALLIAGWKMAVLTGVSFALFGMLGYWNDSMDTLIVTFMSVAICLLIGIPTGIWMGRSKRATSAITPILDGLQTLPSFVYLLPITLFFSIGVAAAVIVTLIYALPPVIRITAHGIRSVSPSTIEAMESLGTNRSQMLRKVQLPLAKRTIIVGVNQTTMSALSMATIAAFVDGPGLGKPVIKALESLDVGRAATAGLCIVIMAIMLDRVTTAASIRAESIPSAETKRIRWIIRGVVAIATVVCVVLSRQYLNLSNFPKDPDLGTPFAKAADSVSNFFADNAATVTNAIKDGLTYGLLNPLQSLLAQSPWWLVALALVALSILIGGMRSFLTSIVCIAVILAVGLWQDSMITLTMTLVATILTMVLALVFGVWMAQSRAVDLVVRPILDAAQVVPPFVYLVPALALFGATRFTAIVAAVVYAAPVAIKLVCDAIRDVSPTVVEAAQSAGSSRWQIISKVQLPMARKGIALATNQGMLYVFAMVVIGGLVGAGALGYLVVAGFSQAELYGKGLAAGIAIVALAIMLDRMAQGTSARRARTGKRTFLRSPFAGT